MVDRSETPQQRRARYLRLAVEAEANAKRCNSPDLREAYLALARSWNQLAGDTKSTDSE
jgi:hypothetical protein